MKKKRILSIAICTLAVICLTGCAKKGSTSKNDAVPQGHTENEPEHAVVYEIPIKEKDNEEEDDATVIYLGQYCEDRTWVFYNNDYTLLDTKGNAVVRLDDLIIVGWIDNGYTHATQYGSPMYYTISNDGDITSQYISDYSGEQVIACGGGYTVTVEDISGFDSVGFQYRVYNADGTVNGGFTIDRNYGDLVKYIGSGVFDIGDGYYCAKGAKWIENVPYSYSAISSEFIDNKMIIGVTYAGDNRKSGLLILTAEGRIDEIYPEGLSSWCSASPIANGYCVIFDEGNNRIVSVNTSTGESYILDESYYKNLSHNAKPKAPVDGRIAIPMEGADGNTYSAIFDTKFNLIAQTQLGDFGRASDGRFVVSIESMQDAVYDTNGKYLFSISDMGYSAYVNNQRNGSYSCGALLVSQIGKPGACQFIDTDGKLLFDRITFNGTKAISTK